MRTTLTLDDDVAILLKRLSEERQMSFRTLVNEALREGLRQLEAPASQPAFRMEPVSRPTSGLHPVLLAATRRLRAILS
jgi:hypothetical protein